MILCQIRRMAAVLLIFSFQASSAYTEPTQRLDQTDSIATDFPVGMEFEVIFPAFISHLTLVSDTQLHFAVAGGPSGTVEIQVIPVREGVFAVSWKEADGTTVVNIQDFAQAVVHTFASMPDGKFYRMTEPIKVLKAADAQR